LLETAKGLPPWILVIPFIIVLFDNVVIPDTFNDDLHVVALFNVVLPDTFNDDNNVDALETNKLEKLVLWFKLLKIVVDVACKLDIFNTEFVEKLFKLLKMVVDVACRLDILDTEIGHIKTIQL
jgi:hypothetical protein